MTNVKGTAFQSTLRFIEERFGADGLQQVLGRLTPEERRPIEGGVLASSWYPFPLLLRLMRLTREHSGDRVPDLYREMGRASADYAVTTVYKIFFKVGSPQFIIQAGAFVFKTYYDTGELKTVVSEKGHAALELVGFQDPAPEFCERLQGWMQRTLELSGGNDLRLLHPLCASKGDPLCRFEGWWS